MNRGRTRKEMKRDRESHYEGLAECTPDQKARDWFRRPAGVQVMIQAQAEQIHETPAEYIARKFNIRGDADGPGEAEQTQEE